MRCILVFIIRKYLIWYEIERFLLWLVNWDSLKYTIRNKLTVKRFQGNESSLKDRATFGTFFEQNNKS